jgi:Domain of unknown function (DUF1707)
MGAVGLVGTRDREVAAAALRRHYVLGRLSLEELEARLHLAVGARTSSDLAEASVGLAPRWLDGEEVRRIGRLARKGATLAALTAVWLVSSLVLLLGFAVEAFAHGASSGGALAFLLVWLAVSLGAWRAGRRA